MITSACCLGLFLATQVPPPPAPGAKVSELRREYEAVLQREADALSSLADRLQKRGKQSEAEECRHQMAPAPSPDGASRFVPLPEIVPRKAKALSNVPVKGKGEPSESWRSELRNIRETCGKSLFDVAQKAGAQTPGQFAVADQALRGVVERLPDHAETRRYLGYIPYEGGWATPFAVSQLRKKMAIHPTFGWVHESWLPHLEQGELPAPKSRGQSKIHWLPAAQADELHRRWDSRWKILTEHFEIHTNVPLSEAIAFGRQLETFYGLFFSLFADVLRPDHPSSLASRFKNKAKNPEAERPPAPHLVYYFATKSEYIDFLAPLGDPEIAKTLGRYFPPKPGQARRAPAYLFHDPGGQLESSATLFHEVSHQLLFETAGRSAFERNIGNYWVFEGLGTYFETVSIQPDGTVLVGGRGTPRIEEAKIRLADRHELVPIETFVNYSQNEFNNRESIHLHYAQAMALTVYLMQANSGEHREAFLDYVKDAHRGSLKRDAGKSLRERVGIPYAKMDRDLIHYLEEPESEGETGREARKSEE